MCHLIKPASFTVISSKLTKFARGFLTSFSCYVFFRNYRTSLFIVGSSTYAQLLVVICIVAALSEVVTHNVSFIYFEVSFAQSQCRLVYIYHIDFHFSEGRTGGHEIPFSICQTFVFVCFFFSFYSSRALDFAV